MDDGMQQQTQRIDENMPLLDQLVRIEPMWIDAGPLFQRSSRFIASNDQAGNSLRTKNAHCSLTLRADH
jgi:hypothetical protein